MGGTMKKVMMFLILMCAWIMACFVSPNPVFRLHTVSDEKEVIWLHGKEYSKLTGRDTDVILAFDEVDKFIVSFDAEIINRGSESMLVSSELFTAYYLDEKYVEIKNISRQPAIDPEDKLLQLDKALSKEDARYAQESGNKSIASFFDLAADISSIGTENTDEEKEQEAEEDMNEDIQNDKDENFHTGVITNLSGEKDRWQFSALRKTTLPADHSVDGKIYFPLISAAQYIRIVFNESKENLNTIFRIDRFAAQ
jgi:hypothetical protein